jgi:cytoplasmic iron level regulating protein YaaA (DUF328/UPF0246 family)
MPPNKGEADMFALIAPARNMRPRSVPGLEPTRAPFLSEAEQLVQRLRAYDPWQLESLLDVNAHRALELHAAYQRFTSQEPGWSALAAYEGAAYRNMGVGDFTPEDFAFAQGHLRIFSALYGLLRPLDGIVDHRLGMRVPPEGVDLYEFWGDKLYRALRALDGPIVNLASAEYAKLITPYLQPGDEMITCRFLKQYPNGARGTVATVRAARGLMTRYLIKERVSQPEGLMGFCEDRYRFIEGLSDAKTYVFIKER